MKIDSEFLKTIANRGYVKEYAGADWWLILACLWATLNMPGSKSGLESFSRKRVEELSVEISNMLEGVENGT